MVLIISLIGIWGYITINGWKFFFEYSKNRRHSLNGSSEVISGSQSLFDKKLESKKLIQTWCWVQYALSTWPVYTWERNFKSEFSLHPLWKHNFFKIGKCDFWSWELDDCTYLAWAYDNGVYTLSGLDTLMIQNQDKIWESQYSPLIEYPIGYFTGVDNLVLLKIPFTPPLITKTKADIVLWAEGKDFHPLSTLFWKTSKFVYFLNLPVYGLSPQLVSLTCHPDMVTNGSEMFYRIRKWNGFLAEKFSCIEVSDEMFEWLKNTIRTIWNEWVIKSYNRNDFITDGTHLYFVPHFVDDIHFGHEPTIWQINTEQKTLIKIL